MVSITPNKGLKDLARDLQKTKRELLAAGNRAVKKTAEYGVKVAQRESSGTVSTAALSRSPWNHPYSVKRPGTIPYGDPGVINIQSGIFKRSWEIYNVWTLASGIKILGVRNMTSYAEFLQHGTKKMVKRPIDALVEREIARVFPINLALELERALKTSMVKK